MYCVNYIMQGTILKTNLLGGKQMKNKVKEKQGITLVALAISRKCVRPN